MQKQERLEAEWIWPVEAVSANAHVLFRASFRADGPLLHPQLRIGAESAAKVFLNGKLVHRYTSLNYPGQHYLEQRELAGDDFRSGVNELAVLAWWRGLPSGASTPKDPGLLLEISEGRQLLCRSGEDWKYAVLPAWYRTELRSKWFNLDCMEYLDHRKLPEDFPFVPMDTPWLQDGPRATPVPGVRYLEQELRPFPLNREELRTDRWKLIRQGTVANLEPDFPCAARAVSAETFEDRQELPSSAVEVFPLKVPAVEEGKAYSFLFHSTTYQRGYPEIHLRSELPFICDLSWHERLSEDHIENASTTVYTTDRHIFGSGIHCLESLDWIAGHYLQLTFRGLDGQGLPADAVKVSTLGFIETWQELPAKCELEAESAELQRVIDLSLRAARMCMLDNIMDCPWRERRQWIGDAQRIGLINHYCFADTRLLRAVLKQHARLQQSDGPFFVCQPLNEEFPAQSFDYLHALREYERYTGDRSLIDDLEIQLSTFRKWYRKFMREDGLFLFDHLPCFNWLDNPLSPVVRLAGSGKPIFSMNLRYLQALQDLEWFFDRQGDDRECDRIRAEAEKLREAILPYFSDPESDLFLELGLREKEENGHAHFSELGHALAGQLGLGEGDGLARFRLWQQGRVTGDERFIPASPYGKWQTLRMFGEAGRKEELLEEILRSYLPIIESDSDTLWEGFVEGGGLSQMSLCHGWGGTVVLALLRYLADWDPRSPQDIEVDLPGGLGRLKVNVPSAS